MSVQSMKALARAQEVRRGRVEIKRALFAGTILLPAAMDSPYCATMSVAELLMCLKRWGRCRTARALRELQISELRRVGDLTARQRQLLVKVARGERVLP